MLSAMMVTQFRRQHQRYPSWMTYVIDLSNIIKTKTVYLSILTVLLSVHLQIIDMKKRPSVNLVYKHKIKSGHQSNSYKNTNKIRSSIKFVYKHKIRSSYQSYSYKNTKQIRYISHIYRQM